MIISTTKHTPGPWIEDNGFIRGERLICKVHYEYMRYGMPARKDIEAEDDANASLLAAAPELFAACLKVWQWLNALEKTLDQSDPLRELRRKYHEPYVKALEAAIKQAEGHAL